MLWPERQNNGNPDARRHPRLELCGDEGAADTQISEPAVSYQESASRHADRKINLDALAPTMFHQPMVSYFVASPHRTNTDTARDNSYAHLGFGDSGGPGRGSLKSDSPRQVQKHGVDFIKAVRPRALRIAREHMIASDILCVTEIHPQVPLRQEIAPNHSTHVIH